MFNFKYVVIAFTPLLGAGGFAQGLNLGMNDGLTLQAQAPLQTGSSYGSQYGNRAGTPMGGVIQRLDAPGPGTENVKSTRGAHAKMQARKGEKKGKDTRAN